MFLSTILKNLHDDFEPLTAVETERLRDLFAPKANGVATLERGYAREGRFEHNPFLRDQAASEPRLLIVDDDAGLLRMMKEVLADGYVIKTTSNGWEALGMTVGFSPDVILTDYHLPGINGLRLIEHIKRMGIPTRILMITADQDPDVIDAAKALGVECLSKPFDLAYLVDTVAELSRRRRR